jgi:hypothetical protein
MRIFLSPDVIMLSTDKRFSHSAISYGTKVIPKTEKLPFCSHYFQVREKGRTCLFHHNRAMLRAAQELHHTSHLSRPVGMIRQN